VLDDPALVRQAMVRGHRIVPDHGRRVTDVLKGMLRPSLMADKGKLLVVADWAAIEARVTPWASNSAFGANKLNIFAKGEDVYKHNAMATFHVGYGDVDTQTSARSVRCKSWRAALLAALVRSLAWAAFTAC
jgi:hypothetical protein